MRRRRNAVLFVLGVTCGAACAVASGVALRIGDAPPAEARRCEVTSLGAAACVPPAPPPPPPSPPPEGRTTTTVSV